VEFVDGTQGFLTWRDLGLDQRLGDLHLDTARPDTYGSAIEIDTVAGDSIDVDALAVKALLDVSTACRLSIWEEHAGLALARRIREARIGAGLTQKQLGKRSGIDQAVISRLERARNRPRVDTVKRLAIALEITVAELLDG
jgi:DNA-binding XRE family transcriptional regulator